MNCSARSSLPINTILFTRDGKKIGNALVVSYDSRFDSYSIKTDYGNVIHNVSLDGILCSFEIGEVTTSSHKHYQYRSR